MEKGLFLPSVSSLFGMRTKSGVEAAFGPNVSLSGVAMVLAVGITVKAGQLNIPINLSFVPGKKQTIEEQTYYGGTYITLPELDYNTGSRISLTMGFNFARF